MTTNLCDVHTDLLGERVSWTIQYGQIPYDVTKEGVVRGVAVGQEYDLIVEYAYQGQRRLTWVRMKDVQLLPHTE